MSAIRHGSRPTVPVPMPWERHGVDQRTSRGWWCVLAVAAIWVSITMMVVPVFTRMSVSSAGRDSGEPKCQHLAGPCLDTFVSQQVLAALEPAALELSLTATERLEQERTKLERHGPQRRERAAYEVERAARQYHAVEPEHRLVARTLERAWEEKLVLCQTKSDK
jgi:hypothetical protein